MSMLGRQRTPVREVRHGDSQSGRLNYPSIGCGSSFAQSKHHREEEEMAAYGRLLRVAADWCKPPPVLGLFSAILPPVGPAAVDLTAHSTSFEYLVTRELEAVGAISLEFRIILWLWRSVQSVRTLSAFSQTLASG
jgi:hypothetical protein